MSERACKEQKWLTANVQRVNTAGDWLAEAREIGSWEVTNSSRTEIIICTSYVVGLSSRCF